MKHRLFNIFIFIILIFSLCIGVICCNVFADPNTNPDDTTIVDPADPVDPVDPVEPIDPLAEYIISFDYGIVIDFFKTQESSLTIKAIETLNTLPEIKDDYSGSFLGWFEEGGSKQLLKNTYVNKNMTVYPKFNIKAETCLSGLYKNGKYIKTWQQVKEEHSSAFKDGGTRLYAEEESFLTDLEGELVIDSSIKKIGYNSFYKCSGLTEIIIPQTVDSIGVDAFKECSSLKNISLPQEIILLASGTFAGCTSLLSIEIASKVKVLSEYAFDGCCNLTSIKVDVNNTVYDSRNNCNAIILTETNELLLGCKNTIIPNSIKSIGRHAFKNCELLTSIEIPNSITEIKSSAFSNCKNLTSITIPNAVKKIERSVFSGCSDLTTVILHNEITEIDSSAFMGCNNLSTISITEKVEQIGSMSFFSCSNLKTILINSENITNTLTSSQSNGYLINYANTVYIKSGLSVSGSTYLLENFTKQTTSDKAGYDMYLKNAA